MNEYLIKGLRILRDDEMDRDDFDIFDGETYLGVVKDEGNWGQARGQWWAWSIKTGQVGFHATRDDAVAAVATTHLPAGPAGNRTPTRQGDRNSMSIMEFSRRVRVLSLAASLYDGTRTVSACWKEAFAQEWREHCDAVRTEEADFRLCVPQLGGEVHTATVFERDGKVIDVSPLCRTMNQNSRMTKYRLIPEDTHADITCAKCLEYRARREARRARQA